MSADVRYKVSGSGGGRDGKPFSVIDTWARGKEGMTRVSFHKTARAAIDEARAMNRWHRGEER